MRVVDFPKRTVARRWREMWCFKSVPGLGRPARRCFRCLLCG